MGNRDDHCCWIKGKVCPHLITDYTDETGHHRRWACALRAELGDWDLVIKDPRYIEATKDAWIDGLNCRDWPDGEGPNKGVCAECGIE
jgi:hypothetical protein